MNKMEFIKALKKNSKISIPEKLIKQTTKIFMEYPWFYLGNMMEFNINKILDTTLTSNYVFGIKYENIYDHLPFDKCIIYYTESMPSFPNFSTLIILSKINITFENDNAYDVCKKNFNYCLKLQEWCIEGVINFNNNEVIAFTSTPAFLAVDNKTTIKNYPNNSNQFDKNLNNNTFTEKFNELNDNQEYIHLIALMPSNIDPNFTKNVSESDLETYELIHQKPCEITLTFLKLLSCKNVEVINEFIGKRRKNHPRKEIEYKCLKIKIPGKRTVKINNREINEFYFHDAEKLGFNGTYRGHFKTYTEEKPLFGKYSGTWWWSPRFNTNKKRDYTIENEKD